MRAEVIEEGFLPEEGLRTLTQDRCQALSGSAVKAVVGILARWNVRDHEAAALLDCAEDEWDEMRSGCWQGHLTQDQFTRAAALVGLHRALHSYWNTELADQRPSISNQGPIFKEKDQISSMIDGGVVRMLEARQYIDALNNGF